MKMIDLSKFEKIAEDKHTATLKHKDGHSMTILLKALQPVQREQMKRLKMAKGGKVKMYDEGSDDQPVSNDDSAPTSDSSSQPQAQGTTININAGGQAPQATNAPPPVQHSQQSAAPTNVQVPSTANPSQGNIVTSANGSNPLNAVQAQQDAIQQQVPIDSFKAKADVQNQQQWLEENKRRQAMLDDAQNEIHNHTNAFADYINKNPVDEKQYAKSLTGGQKTAGLIGLFLGGFSGNHDMYNQINSNIDRNIDAQKQNIANQKSVYSAYNDLYHNDVLATKMAKISANDMLAHQTQLAASQVGTAQAQQKANEMKAATAIQNQNLLKESALLLHGLRSGGAANGMAAPGTGGNRLAANGSPVGTNSVLAPQGSTPMQSGFNMPNVNPQYAPQDSGTGNDQEAHLLYPDAAEKMQDLRNKATIGHLPIPLDQINDQYNKAAQTEKILGTVDNAFDSMGKAADEGGEPGFLRRNIEAMGAVPVVGPMIEGANDWVTNYGPNRTYDTNKTTFAGDIRNALKDAGVNEAKEIVDKNMPEYADTPEQREMKRKNLKTFIKNANYSRLLEDYGLAPKRDKRQK